MKNKKRTRIGRDLLVNKIFDLMIVIIGVTIAFQLNNMKVRADQRSLAAFYKERIAEELNKDIEEEEGILETLESDKRIAERFQATANPVPDSLVKVVVEVLSLETFTPHQNTYQTLLQGNGLTVFEDRSMQSHITEYYSVYTNITRFEEVYTTVLIKLHEYFSPYCNYETGKLTDVSVLNSNQTRNLLIIVISQLNDGIEAHTQALQKAKALKATLQR